MKPRPLLLAVLVAVPLALAGCSGTSGAASSPSPTAAEVHGSMTLLSGGYSGTSPCLADDGFGDIAAGSEVDIVDGANKVLAVGNLEAGVESTTGCEFDFTVPNVPKGQKIYGVKVGTANRGVVHFPSAQLFSGKAQLSLGS